MPADTIQVQSGTGDRRHRQLQFQQANPASLRSRTSSQNIRTLSPHAGRLVATADYRLSTSVSDYLSAN